MKTFHKACVIIFEIAIANLILFAIIGLIIGGDALSGKVEGSHYYLGNHGQFTETNYFIFWYSKVHAYSLLVTHPLALAAGLLYWVTGGASFRPKSLAVDNHATNNILAISKSLLWKTADLIGGIFWIILDSWRKPDYELFVRLSKQECIQELQFATDNPPTIYNLEKPLWGYFSGTHFYLQKWSYNPLLRDGGASIRPILSGKFSSTPEGTYIRLWNRFTTFTTLFFTVWFGTVLSGLSFYFFLSNQLQTKLDSTLITLTLIVALIFYITMLFISIQIGSFFGKVNNFGIIEFVKNVLDHHHISSRLTGFRLARKMQGKV
jgi:hypothetical protein